MRARWAIVCIALLAGLPGTAFSAALAETGSQRELTGSLTTHEGVRVLRVWGTPYEQGYAHGHLLGREIVSMMEDVLLDPRVMPNPAVYEAMVRGQLVPRLKMDSVYEDELKGMLDGVRDRVGEAEMMLDRLERPLDLDDLKALNTLSDWNPSACSSFAAWGEATEGGGTIVARNLDYVELPHVKEQHLIVVYAEAKEGRKRFMNIVWPSIIGVYTAVNEDGVFVATHDAPAPKAFAAMEWVSRSLAFREVVETAGAADFAERAAEVLKQRQAFRGSNFFIAAPNVEGRPSAAVLEYDGRTDLASGVTMRSAGSAENGTPANTIACTNHYRIRGAAHPCRRYAALVDGLGEAIAPVSAATTQPVEGASGKLDAGRAFDIIRRAAVPITMHTVVGRLNEGIIDVYLASPGHNAVEVDPVRFELGELWKRSP